jgi:hypothetical protein
MPRRHKERQIGHLKWGLQYQKRTLNDVRVQVGFKLSKVAGRQKNKRQKNFIHGDVRRSTTNREGPATVNITGKPILHAHS